MGKTLFESLKSYKKDLNLDFNSKIQNVENWSNCCLETRKNFTDKVFCTECENFVRFIDEFVHPSEVEKLIKLFISTTLEEFSFILPYLFNSGWDILFEFSSEGLEPFKLVNVTTFEWFPNYKKHRLGESVIEILEVTVKKTNEKNFLIVENFGILPEDFECIPPETYPETDE